MCDGFVFIIIIVVFHADLVSSDRARSRSRSNVRSEPAKAVGDADDMYVVFFAYRLFF